MKNTKTGLLRSTRKDESVYLSLVTCHSYLVSRISKINFVHLPYFVLRGDLLFLHINILWIQSAY
jgi:hypothetical protein